ncbi:uncharacterized protein [Parasteatoda tepidariorum]|uniref:uncharacterized protein n=1 Tax=Parasteatoda tepidariorum TaxID=114398 RepID=UPI001C71CB5A|nr:RNA exonuclease 1 [Parasteatoda tepidariorum]
METNGMKPVTFDIRKEKRFQAKKRKLEALLNLFQEEDKSLTISNKKKTSTTLQEDYKTLKDELKKYTRKPDMEPGFYLTDTGYKSLLRLKDKKLSKNVKPLFVKDIYQVLLKSVIGHMSPYSNIKWSKLEQPQNIVKTVFLVIEGLPKKVVLQNRTSLSNLTEIFPFVFDIASSNLPFPQELTTLHKVTHFHIENGNSYSSMFPSKKSVQVKSDENLQKPSKVHLLLSPIQLVMENYPLPKSVFEYSKSDNYSYSKEKYVPVTANSPLFALDCEMCRTDKSNSELTRIAVVNENHEVVYHSLVKPKAKIIDYLTKFSGITKSMLSGVKTRLEDVQRELRAILPSDAILCGQSLNCDLHALKMIHPYVIDTSIIFNCSGIRHKKDSLKYLSMVHLNENIQGSKMGHSPVEDALATMKLVQLKLNNTISYGDLCIGDGIASNNVEKDIDIKFSGESKQCNEEENGVVISEKTDENENKEQLGMSNESQSSFFDLTSKYEKKVCLIGPEPILNFYGDNLPETIDKKTKFHKNKIIKETLNNMDNFNLTISHVEFNTNEESDWINELNELVKLVFDNCSARTMFMVFISGKDMINFQDIVSGMFMATVKKS